MKSLLKYIGTSVVIASTLFACTEELPGVGSIEDLTPPKADFSFKSSQESFKEILFTNTSISAGIFTWEFGDGTTSDERNPVHSYPGEGEYSVKLIAKDGNDKSSETTLTVAVIDELIPEFQCKSFECSDRSVWGSFSGSGSPTPPDGSTGAKINKSSHFLDQTITVTGGVTYNVSFHYVSKSGGSSAGELLLEDPDNGIKFIEESIPMTDNSSDYVYKSYVVETANNTSQLRFSLNYGDVEARFDLVEIKKVD